MDEKKKHGKAKGILVLVALAAVLALILFALSRLGILRDWFGKKQGDLIGQNFTISEYDDYGNKTLSMAGDSVSIGLFKNAANNDTESTGFSSEVLEITIDRHAVYEVGNTLIFAEDGLDMITDFEVDGTIDTSDGNLSMIPLDRLVNNLKNDIGKSKVIIICSQMGLPIGVYQGNSVYVTVPSDLPKTTRINIDGKSLYINRANYTILDADMLA
jgi:hypothetical protein